MKLRRAGVFTDIHFGKKSNSDVHNQDCLRFIDWFCERVIEHKCDHVIFMGDWHENRNAISVSTLKYSYIGAKRLNSLGIPVFMVAGNHDLYKKTSRDVHSIHHLNELTNIRLIETAEVIPEIGNGALLAPFMFHDEYETVLKQYTSVPVWFGHFEFKGFIVTGYNTRMPVGPDINDFRGPKYIFSGHFHKRQAQDHVVYIGNAFPMDFGDSGDFERGMMVYDFSSDEVEFYNWEDCPKYMHVRLSDVVEGRVKIHKGSRVKCTADISIDFEEQTKLRKLIAEKYILREFTLEEPSELRAALTETEFDIADKYSETSDIIGVDDLMVEMLKKIDVEEIDTDMLIYEYSQLTVKNT